MKVIRVHRFGGPEVLELDDVPDPIPGPGQVVVRVRAAGVNPVDAYVRTGTYPVVPSLPYVPGQDGAGTIEAVGADVRGFAVDDRVFFAGTSRALSGAYAERCACDVAKVFPLPARVSFAQGAAVGTPYGTAYRALVIKARAIAGETVLVHGASGGVGIAAVQLGAALGLVVIGTASTEAGRARVLAEGAAHVLDHARPGYLERVKALTGGRGVDVVVESLANQNFANDLDAIAPGGRIVIVGNRGPTEVNLRAAMTKEATILGLALGTATPREVAATYAAIGAGLANGTLRPIVARELALADAARAHALVMTNGVGKLVLVP